MSDTQEAVEQAASGAMPSLVDEYADMDRAGTPEEELLQIFARRVRRMEASWKAARVKGLEARVVRLKAERDELVTVVRYVLKYKGWKGLWREGALSPQDKEEQDHVLQIAGRYEGGTDGPND